MDTNDLTPELKALFEEAVSLPEPDLKGMEEAHRALACNPEVTAKVMGGLFINKILGQMDVLDMSQSQLAKSWGKDRQYISSILNTEKPKNFTLKTVAELSMKVGLRVKLEFEPLYTASVAGRFLHFDQGVSALSSMEELFSTIKPQKECRATRRIQAADESYELAA